MTRKQKPQDLNKPLITSNQMQEKIVEHLTRTGITIPYSLAFGNLKSDRERLLSAHGKLNELNLLPEFKIDQKNNKTAMEWRLKAAAAVKSKNFEEALSLFTKALLYCKDGSEEMYLVYRGRAALLGKLKFFKESKADLQRCLNLTKDEKAIDTFNKQIEILEKLVGACKITKKDLYYMEPNDVITNFKQDGTLAYDPSLIDIGESKKFGRYIFAKKDLDIGQVIAVEKPYCSMLLQMQQRHCHECLELCYNLFPCANCTITLYCSVECQEKAKSYHQYECPILLTFEIYEITRLELISLKIALKAQNEYNVLDKVADSSKSTSYRSDRYLEIHNLGGNTDKRSVSDIMCKAITGALCYDLIKKHTNFFQSSSNPNERETRFTEILMRLLQIAGCNFHELTELAWDSQLENYGIVEVGVGAFSFLSLFNHSCFPNVSRTTHGTTEVMRTCSVVKKGEQLFDNYGYHSSMKTKAERQASLKRLFYFRCECHPCKINLPLYIDMPRNQIISKSLFDIHKKVGLADRDQAKHCSTTLIKELTDTKMGEITHAFCFMQECLKQCWSSYGNCRRPLVVR